MTATYSPVVKARNAEIKVLSTSPHRSIVTPIFELQKAPQSATDRETGKTKRTKSTATDVSYFLDDIARQWQQPMYIDISRIAEPNGKRSWWRLLANLAEISSGAGSIAPVVHAGDGVEATSEASSLAVGAGRAALRVKLPHPNPSVLASEISTLATSLGVEPSQIDVLLDWEDRLEQHRLDDLQAGTASVIESLGKQCGKIVTLGTPDTRRCQQAGDWEIERREWMLWLRLVAAGLDVAYGDYALYPPSDPVPATPRYGHLRYSHQNTLWVHRRATPSRAETAAGAAPGLAGAFGICCQHLVESDHYYGPRFSDADHTISEAATGERQIGQAGMWREIALGHHLTTVVTQLADRPEPPPPGTT